MTSASGPVRALHGLEAGARCGVLGGGAGGSRFAPAPIPAGLSRQGGAGGGRRAAPTAPEHPARPHFPAATGKPSSPFGKQPP